MEKREYDLRRNSREGFAKLKMRLWCVNWGVFVAERCFFANWGSEIRVFQDLHTRLSRRRNFTGSLERISMMSSKGRVGGGA